MEELKLRNIVIINGSPKRESDSEKLTQRFLESLKQNKLDANIQLFKLSQMNVKNCLGCLKCKNEGICPQNDDIEKIKSGLHKADFVIFSSPVHVTHVSSIFHNFIERSIVDLHTFEYMHKPFVNIVSTNGSGEEDVDKFLTKIGLLFGMIKVGFTFISKNDLFKEKNFNKLVKKSFRILNGEIRLKPTIKNKMYFTFMKKTIKDNPEYFVFENKIWNERSWFSK